MHLFGRGLGWVLLGFVASSVGCSAGSVESSDSGSGPEGTETANADQAVGQFRFTVDPQADQPVKVERIAPEHWQRPGFDPQTTTELPDTSTVLNNAGETVTLTGPGKWNATKQNLEATVTIAHDSHRATDLDELQMVVLTLSDPTVQFLTSDNTKTGVGAVMAFADVQYPSPTATDLCAASTTYKGVKSSAKRFLSIHDSNPATSFSFTVDVRAKTGTGLSIVPDCDGDGFNTEKEDAGNDCDAFAVDRYGTGFKQVDDKPCTCNSGSASECTGGSGSCQLASPYTCNAGNQCTCVVDTTNPDTTVTCKDNCSVVCTGTSDGTDSGNAACTVNCNDKNAPANCDLTCTGTTGGDCLMNCAEAGHTCNLTCSGTNASDCLVSCDKDAGCNATCSGTGSDPGSSCGVSTCKKGFCDVTCGTTTVKAAYPSGCGVDQCQSQGGCNVTCVNADKCILACTANAAPCTMDCSKIPVAERDAKCLLTCMHGINKAANGKWSCL